MEMSTLKRRKGTFEAESFHQDHLIELLILGHPLSEENLGVPTHWTPISHLSLTLHPPSITTVAQGSSRTTRNIVKRSSKR